MYQPVYLRDGKSHSRLTMDGDVALGDFGLIREHLEAWRAQGYPESELQPST